MFISACKNWVTIRLCITTDSNLIHIPLSFSTQIIRNVNYVIVSISVQFCFKLLVLYNATKGLKTYWAGGVIGCFLFIIPYLFPPVLLLLYQNSRRMLNFFILYWQYLFTVPTTRESFSYTRSLASRLNRFIKYWG
jgi:hypothetical protein